MLKTTVQRDQSHRRQKSKVVPLPDRFKDETRRNVPIKTSALGIPRSNSGEHPLRELRAKLASDQTRGASRRNAPSLPRFSFQEDDQ